MWWFQDWFSSAAQLCHQNSFFWWSFPLCLPQCLGHLLSWCKMDDYSRFWSRFFSISHNLSLTHTQIHTNIQMQRRGDWTKCSDWKRKQAFSILWSFSTSLMVISQLFSSLIYLLLGFPGDSDGKESACSAEDLGLIPGLGRSPGEGNG